MAFGTLGRAGGATVRLGVDDNSFRRDLVRDELLFRKTVGSMNNNLGALSRGIASSTGAMSKFGGVLALTSGSFFAGAGLGAAFTSTINLAGDFQRAMNILGSVTKATAGQIALARKEALRLGADAKLPATSARDAANAMTELAKAGLSVDQTIAAARGTLQLAAAAQIDESEAAQIAARALNAFGLQGEDANRVADVLAASANATSASMEDMAIALQQSSAVAHQFGLSIEDTAAAIGEMSNAGVIGSDAGTSLRVMLSRLVPVTQKAKDLMDELGIKVTDASGHYLSFRQIVKNYHDALVTLTPVEQQRVRLILFGQDAQRAANIVLGQGVEQFDKMKDAVSRQGAAAELSAAQNKGYKGALDAFKSSVETLQIVIGTKLLPIVTRQLKAMTEWISNTKNQKAVTDGVVGAFELFTDILKTLIGVIKTVDRVTGSFKNTLLLLLGLKFAFVIRGWIGALTLLIGAESGGGLLGAAGAAVKFRKALATLYTATVIGGLSSLGSSLATILASLTGMAAVLAGGGIAAGIAAIYEKLLPDFKGKNYSGIDLFNDLFRGGAGGKDKPGPKLGPPAPSGYGKSILVPSSLTAAIARGGLLQGPHPTEGLTTTKTAVDISMKPGAQVLAPENGYITRTTGHAPHSSGAWNINGYSLYFLATDGSAYFITHLAAIGKRGFYRKGAVIAIVADHTQGGAHIHVEYSPPIRMVKGKDTSSPPSRGIAPGQAPPAATSGTDTLGGDKGSKGPKVDFNLHVPESLSDAQQAVAETIYETAIALGASPEVALAMVVGAYLESRLNPKAAGGGLFQIISAGLHKTYLNYLRRGYGPVEAAVMTMLGRYVESGKKNRGRGPVAIAYGAERPAKPYEQTQPAAVAASKGFTLVRGSTTGTRSRGPTDPISDALYTKLTLAQDKGDLASVEKILDEIIAILDKLIAKAKIGSKKRRELVDERSGFLRQRRDVRETREQKFIDKFIAGLRADMAKIEKQISEATGGGLGNVRVEDVVDKATGQVTGHQLADVKVVKFDPKTGKVTVTKIKPVLAEMKKGAQAMQDELVKLQETIKKLNAAMNKLLVKGKVPKKNAVHYNNLKKQRDALLKYRDEELIPALSALLLAIDDAEEALAAAVDANVDEGPKDSGGDQGGPQPYDVSIPIGMQYQGFLAAQTPGQEDDIAVFQAQVALQQTRYNRAQGPEQLLAAGEALQSARAALFGVLTSVPIDIQLAQARAHGTTTLADDQALSKKILDLTNLRIKEFEAMQQTTDVMEALIGLIERRNQLEEELKQTRQQENQELVAYLTARRELVRQYAGNLYSPTGMRGGAGITLNNYFTGGPTDPHLFSSQVAFDLGALVG